MKVGKKALSCLLAIIMIVSSCSVCFSVLGADTGTAAVYDAINMHYDSLMAAIDKAKDAEEKAEAKGEVPDYDSADFDGVIVKRGSTWVVERDTLNGGWLALSRAIANYAKANVASYKTYVDLVEAIKADAAGYTSSTGITAVNYGTILDYYKFGSHAKGSFSSQETVTLKIGTGFDLLAFNTVEDLTDKTYSTAELKFTPKAAGDEANS
jgi:hypothetical protein